MFIALSTTAAEAVKRDNSKPGLFSKLSSIHHIPLLNMLFKSVVSLLALAATAFAGTASTTVCGPHLTR